MITVNVSSLGHRIMLNAVLPAPQAHMASYCRMMSSHLKKSIFVFSLFTVPTMTFAQNNYLQIVNLWF